MSTNYHSNRNTKELKNTLFVYEDAAPTRVVSAKKNVFWRGKEPRRRAGDNGRLTAVLARAATKRDLRVQRQPNLTQTARVHGKPKWHY